MAFLDRVPTRKRCDVCGRTRNTQLSYCAAHECLGKYYVVVSEEELTKGEKE